MPSLRLCAVSMASRLSCALALACGVRAASGGLAVCTSEDPAAKAVVCGMDHALVGLGQGWRNYTEWSDAMRPFWAPDFVYTPAYGIQETVGLQDWYYGENLIWFKAFPNGVFNQMLFLGDEVNASSMTYSIGVWEAPLGPLAPTHRRATARICDFYHVSQGRIMHNWMMLDMLDLLRQAGHHPLALSPLPQGRHLPPRAMEGIPAPISIFVNRDDGLASRRVVEAVLAAEWEDDSEALLGWSEDLLWYGPVPFGMARGRAEYLRHFLRPLHAAFGARSVRLDTFTCEGKFCAAHGTFSGNHTGTWLGYQASGLRLSLDFGMHWHMSGGKILESWAIFDLPKMFLPLGVDLLGGHWPSGAASAVMFA